MMCTGLRYKDLYADIKRLCDIYPTDAELLPILCEKYKWTIGQAYMATEQFRRPENYN